MSRLVKNLIDLLRGGDEDDEDDERNESAAPLNNDGASPRHRSQPNISTSIQRPTSRRRRGRLTRTVTLEQMERDGVSRFINAGRLTADDIWGPRIIPNRRVVTTQNSQINTDANPAPSTTGETRPRSSNNGRRNSNTERRRDLDDWDNIPLLSLDEIMADMVIPANEPDHVPSTHDLSMATDAAPGPSDTNREWESNWSLWRRSSPLTGCGMARKRKHPDAFGDWDEAGYMSVDEIMKGTQLSTGSPLKRRKRASTTDLPDATAEQSNHTISTPRSQVRTSADTLDTTRAEQRQTSRRIPRRRKKRATRRNGKRRPRTH